MRHRSTFPAYRFTRFFFMLALYYLMIISFATSARKARFRDRCNKTVEIQEDVKSPLVTSENRGRSLHCSYKFRPTMRRTDLIISIRFYRLKVGRMVNISYCADGYVQIIEGYDGSAISNRKAPGYFCGELEQSQTYVSETSFVKVTFFAKAFSEDTHFSFDSRMEQKFEIYARYGPNPSLYPDRRGKLINGTFCDRIFKDCRLGTCYVQSPGYPGIYPRNLNCRYFLHTKDMFINPHLENEVISIDGQRCGDIIICPLRPVTTNCPGDYLRIYDGWTETSPIIGTFCGTGRFPYSITGSSNQLLLVFVSTPAGPMLNTGFHFNVGSNPKWIGQGAAKVNGSCSATFNSSDKLSEPDRVFYSLVTWYSPHTSCYFHLRGRPEQIIRLYFKSFRIHPPQHLIDSNYECAESLVVYDSDVPDEAKVMAIFCDTWGAIAKDGMEFISTGANMLIQYKSVIGSYSGSSLNFWIQFDFYDSNKHGEHVGGTVCDRIFQSSKLSSGTFGSPLNPLAFRQRTSLTCNYIFQADTFLSERVFITLSILNFDNANQTCEICLTDPVDKMVIQELTSDSAICLCNNSINDNSSLIFLSIGYNLDLRYFYQMEPSDNFENKIETFKGAYEFFHGPLCGPSVIELMSQGELEYPNVILDEYDAKRSNVRCIWTIPVMPRMDVYLWFLYLFMPTNCSSDRIDIRIPPSGRHYTTESLFTICGEKPVLDLPIIDSSIITANKFLVELITTFESNTQFKLVITQVVRDSERGFFYELGIMSPCSFLCPGSNVCISHDLVCNGVRNCPLNAFTVADEETSLCGSRPFRFNWLALVAGGVGGLLLTVCLMIAAKCCRRGTNVKNSRAVAS